MRKKSEKKHFRYLGDVSEGSRLQPQEHGRRRVVLRRKVVGPGDARQAVAPHPEQGTADAADAADAVNLVLVVVMVYDRLNVGSIAVIASSRTWWLVHNFGLDVSGRQCRRKSVDFENLATVSASAAKKWENVFITVACIIKL